jgi:hypothetical protein
MLSFESEESLERTTSKTTWRLVATIFVVSVVVVCALVASDKTNSKLSMKVSALENNANLRKHKALEAVVKDNSNARYLKIEGSFTGNEASAECEKHGMELASIHSASENAEAANVCGPNCWIGLHRNQVGAWTWVDGSAMDFSNWALGEPNNMGNYENCVEMWPWPVGSWNDVSCNGENGWRKPALCQPSTAPKAERTCVTAAPNKQPNHGEITVPKAGQLKGVKLTYVSGEWKTCGVNSPPNCRGRFGFEMGVCCTGDGFFK